MKAVTNKNEEFCKKLLKRIAVVGLLGMFLPSAQAIFEMGYTFESPSTANNVFDFNSTYNAEAWNPWGGSGSGPALTAPSAKHGNVGLDFTGNMLNDYGLLWTKTNSLTFQHGFTLAFWLNPASLPTSGNAFTLYWAGLNRGTGETHIYLNANGTVGLYNAGNGAWNTTSTLASNEWSHLAVTWDDTSDSLTFYKNGVVDSTITGVTTLNGANSPTPSPLIFGQAYNLGGNSLTQFRGYMDDIYLSDFSHTQSEIQNLMIAIPEPSAVALVGVSGLAFLYRRRFKSSRESCKKLLKLIPVLSVMGMLLPSARAVEILYTFDDPNDTTSALFDQRTADGSQNAYAPYNFPPYNGVWALAPGSGIRDTTAGLWANTDGLIGAATFSNIEYTSAMTWSVAIKPTSAASSGYSSLFWSGVNRGTGESQLYIDPTGRLVWYEAGIGAFSTPTPVFVLNSWQSMGMTFDSAVGGGTLILYVGGQPVQTFTGLGAMVSGGNGDPSGPTVFGFPWGVGGAGTGQYRGYADNIFMADRALSASEMEVIQFVPEPSSVAMMGLGGLVLLRRLRKH